jgi:anti-anti-sigma factor
MQHTLLLAERVLQVTVPGDLLSTNADPIRTEFLALLETPAVKAANWDTLKLDLTAAKMVDSVGLNLIVAIYKETQKHKAKMAVLVSNPNIQRTFLFTRLDKHLQVVMVA